MIKIFRHTRQFLPIVLSLCALVNSPLYGEKVQPDAITTADYKKIQKTLTPLEGTTPAQWRVIWTDDGRHSATIGWNTALAGKKHIVHLDTKPHGSDISKYAQHIKSSVNNAFTLEAKEIKKRKLKPLFYHFVKLENLKPNTKYYFVIESDGKFSRPLYFITCPDKLPYKLICGGDSRSGLSVRCRMNMRMASEVQKHPEIVAFCHGGDFITNGKDWLQWRTWMSHNELLTLKDGRVIPIIPTRGNHDNGPLFFEIFNLKKDAAKSANEKPEKRRYWQTTKLGGGVNIITLDTNVSPKKGQEKWLEEQLSTLRPKSTWLLVNHHRPLFPAVKSTPEHAKVWVPLFEKYNVDLALESDGHCIKRTVPIRNGKMDPTGVTYIGEGGLGAPQYHPKNDRWYLKGGLVDRGNHMMILDFQPSHIGIDVMLLNGSILDSFKLQKPQKR